MVNTVGLHRLILGLFMNSFFEFGYVTNDFAIELSRIFKELIKALGTCELVFFVLELDQLASSRTHF